MNLILESKQALTRVFVQQRHSSEGRKKILSLNMRTTELRSELHNIVDRIQDDRLLHAVYQFLSQRENSKEGLMWKSLTEDQRKEVLLAYEESEDEANLIDWEEVKKSLK